MTRDATISYNNSCETVCDHANEAIHANDAVFGSGFGYFGVSCVRFRFRFWLFGRRACFSAIFHLLCLCLWQH